MALKGTPITKATSLADLKQYKLGTQIGTTSYDFITQTIQPSQQPTAYDHARTTPSMRSKDGQIDGIVVDFPTAYYMTRRADPGGTVVGQFPRARRRAVGAGAGKDSPLTPCVDKAMAALTADGTLAKLHDRTGCPTRSARPVLQ